MRIIQHWVGPMPEMIQFARWSVRETCDGDVQDVNDVVRDHELLDMCGQDSLHPIQYLADVIRARELRENGGLWLDSDYVALKPLTGFHVPGAFEAVVFTDSYKGTFEYENDFLAIKPGTLWADMYYQEVRTRCYSKRPLEWGDLGRRVLNSMMREPSFSNVTITVTPLEVSLYRGMTNAWDQESPHEFLPIPVTNYPGFGKFLELGTGLQLCHSLSGSYLKEKTVAQWRETATVIGSVIRLVEKNIGKRFQVDRSEL